MKTSLDDRQGQAENSLVLDYLLTPTAGLVVSRSGEYRMAAL